MNANQDIWTLVFEKLSDTFSDTVKTLWFSRIEVITMSDTCAVLVTDSDLKADIINKKYKTALEEVFEATVGFPTEVIVLSSEHHVPNGDEIRQALMRGEKIKPFLLERDEVRTEPLHGAEPYEKEAAASSAPSAPGMAARQYPNASSREYTFENFIVGSSNNFAHGACLAVANNPESPDNDVRQSYNPLFIHGPSGLGKTHLLYAITNRIREKNPDVNIIYVKGEAFTNQMIEAISNQTTAEFRNRYRRADVLLIDDIQFIAGKNSTQEEFFHTFNALYEDHKQIILTSDRPPKDIKTLEDRLKTRFEWGLIADIQPPDLELRIAILRSKAQSMNLEIPYDVQTFLAEKLKNNIRQIEGALKKIGAKYDLTNEPITISLAQSCIADMLSGTEPTHVTVDRIFETVAKKYGVSVEDIKGSRRSKEIAQARHTAVYIIRQVTDLSLKSIGRILNRDHTTMLSSIETLETKIKEDPVTEQEIADLLADIKKDM